MAKFNLKKAILENKATFFGSLTEGQFSWMTQDTGQQIGSQDENKIPVYMFDDKGKYYYENDYDGYGEFGGMDYYELLDQMNGGSGDRSRGIDLAFGKEKTSSEVLFPALVVKPNEFDYKTHDFTKEAETDPNQSWYASEEEDFIDQNDEEVYGSDDNEEELDENKENLKESVKILDRQADLDQAYFNLDVDGTEMSLIYWDYDYLRNGDEATYEEVMEMIEKQLIKVNKYGFPDGIQLTPEQKEEIAQVVLKDLQTNPEWKSNLKENKEIKPTTKMKKSELKAKIKEMIVAEIALDIDNMEDAPESEVDFLAELEGMLNEAEGLTPLQDYVYNYEKDISGEDEAQEFLDDIKKLNTPKDVYDYYAYDRDWSGSMDDDLNNIFKQVSKKFKNLGEAKGDEEVTDDVTADDVTVDDTEIIDTTTTTEVNPDVKAVQDALTQAQAAAQKLGDGKLTDQIGNTITFFTRAHVVEKGAVAEGDLMKNIGKGLEYEATEEMIRDYADRLLGAGVDDVEDLANYYLSNPEELPEPMKYEFFKNNYDDILSVAMTGLGEGKKEDKKEKDVAKDLNEAMFPLLKRILK